MFGIEGKLPASRLPSGIEHEIVERGRDLRPFLHLSHERIFSFKLQLLIEKRYFGVDPRGDLPIE